MKKRILREPWEEWKSRKLKEHLAMIVLGFSLLANTFQVSNHPALFLLATACLMIVVVSDSIFED